MPELTKIIVQVEDKFGEIVEKEAEVTVTKEEGLGWAQIALNQSKKLDEESQVCVDEIDCFIEVFPSAVLWQTFSSIGA